MQLKGHCFIEVDLSRWLLFYISVLLRVFSIYGKMPLLCLYFPASVREMAQNLYEV